MRSNKRSERNKMNAEIVYINIRASINCIEHVQRMLSKKDPVIEAYLETVLESLDTASDAVKEEIACDRDMALGAEAV